LQSKEFGRKADFFREKKIGLLPVAAALRFYLTCDMGQRPMGALSFLGDAAGIPASSKKQVNSH